MLRLSFFLLVIVPLFGLNAQETFQIFKDRRVINAHSVEMLAQKKLDVRITHRFGDLAGANGGFRTFFGLENAADILIGAEYGVTNNLNIGFYRSKGIGSYPDGKPGLRQLLNGLVKYRILQQTEDGGSPLSLVVLGVSTISTSAKSDNPANINFFQDFTDRMAYTIQALVGKKFSDGFSLQLNGAYTHRNLVAFDDINGVVSVGIATRVQLTKIFGILADVTIPFSENRTTTNGFYPSVGIGLEIDTGGHIFQINLINSKGIMETDYIPYSTSNWGESEFRLGFTISRIFNL